MIEIPDFLKREFQGPRREPDEMDRAIDRYVDHFGFNDLTTEPYSYDPEEWAAILDDCIKSNIPFKKYMGLEFEPDVDY